MIAKYGGQCATCYRTLAAGTEVGYTRGPGIRCAGGCAPISTEDLVVGRERYAESEARRAARQSDEPNPYAKHDAANEAYRAGERRRLEVQ